MTLYLELIVHASNMHTCFEKVNCKLSKKNICKDADKGPWKYTKYIFKRLYTQIVCAICFAVKIPQYLLHIMLVLSDSKSTITCTCIFFLYLQVNCI